MARRARFVCEVCGYESPRWLGRCPSCERWNTLVERAVVASPPAQPAPVLALGEEDEAEGARLATGLAELDRVLGGGLVPGSLVLLGGEPGAGKSTLLLQVAACFAARGGRALYASGEESAGQVRLRARRLGVEQARVELMATTDLRAVLEAAERRRPDLLVVDSVQTLALPEAGYAPGSLGQVREAARACQAFAKGTGVPCVLIGHINKEGALAGPKALEHTVDVVLYFEGEAGTGLRVLRAAKNRFGATGEVGLLAMGPKGLEDVLNPSEALLAERPVGSPGSLVVAALEGSRALLVEVQALVAPSALGTPRRMATGVDTGRVSLLLAVLERRLGLGLGPMDVYVKVVGGLRLEEAAADLGVALAVASAYLDRPVPRDLAVFGEVGLAAEVRSVTRAEERVREARRHGFGRVLGPPARAPWPPELAALYVPARTLAEAMAVAFEGR